jgi:hypothetical protein
MEKRNFSIELLEQNPLDFIHDWYTLSVVAKVYPKTLAYAWKNKAALVTPMPQPGGRVVYNPKSSLRTTQKFLHERLIKPLMQNDKYSHIWSYKEGLNIRTKIEEVAGRSNWLVHFDIKKYFDNITFKHCVHALQQEGFNFQGAKMVANYTTVKTKRGNTLQQGGLYSGEIANLVGYYYFDQHIIKMLEDLKTEYPALEYTYVRYCDNVYLFVHTEIDLEALKKYKAGCITIVEKAGFKTHKWNTIPKNHPKRNQKVLGMIINQQARIEIKEFERLRALLFNMCTKSSGEVVYKYFDKFPTIVFETCLTQATKEQSMATCLSNFVTGKINYIADISEKQGLQLKKLKEAARIMTEHIRIRNSYGFHHQNSSVYTELVNVEFSETGVQETLPSEVFSVIKTYTDRTESVEEYVSKVETIAYATLEKNKVEFKKVA